MNVSSVVNVTGSIELRCDVNYAGGWTPHFDCVVESRSRQRQAITLGCNSRTVLLKSVEFVTSKLKIVFSSTTQY